jgi:protein-tyrosine phosphatase
MIAPRAPLVDLHCHILPGLDDGARDLDDAVAMAVQGHRDGIGAICATPHIRHDHDVRIPELPGRRAQLTAALRASGCPVRVLAGGEVAATALDRLDDTELAAVSLGGAGRWILLEPAPGPIDEALSAAVSALHARGFRALIAHPERHLAPDLIARLGRAVAEGALVQATAAFFTEPAASVGMIALARAGALHVLGTDAHSAHLGRPLELRSALGVLATVEPLASHLAWVAETAPRAILAGHDASAPFPVSGEERGRPVG